MCGLPALQRARPWRPEGPNECSHPRNLVTAAALFAAGRRVALFGVPAPFTATCTSLHVPAYAALAGELLSRVDEVVCLSVADPYAMHAWRQGFAFAAGSDAERISFLCDPAAEMAAALGMVEDKSSTGLGHRCARFSMVVRDGVVAAFQVVGSKDAAAEDAANVLAQCTRAD